jgi:tetratricopeptide (TPR) repeat protein
MERDLPTEKQTLLDAYFLGRMSEADRALFEEYLQQDAAFREAFEFQTDLKKALQHQDVTAFRKQLNAIEAKRWTNRPFKPMILVWISAAILLLISTILIYNSGTNNASEQDLYAQYFRPQANIHYPITRNTSDLSLQYHVFIAYESNNWTTAKSLLDSALSIEQRPELAFYLANIYLVEKNYEAAIPLLEQFLESEDSFSDRALWYLALAYIGLEHKDHAIHYLNEVIRTQSYPHEQASELLIKLE